MAREDRQRSAVFSYSSDYVSTRQELHTKTTSITTRPTSCVRGLPGGIGGSFSEHTTAHACPSGAWAAAVGDSTASRLSFLLSTPIDARRSLSPVSSLSSPASTNPNSTFSPVSSITRLTSSRENLPTTSKLDQLVTNPVARIQLLIPPPSLRALTTQASQTVYSAGIVYPPLPTSRSLLSILNLPDTSQPTYDKHQSLSITEGNKRLHPASNYGVSEPAGTRSVPIRVEKHRKASPCPIPIRRSDREEEPPHKRYKAGVSDAPRPLRTASLQHASTSRQVPKRTRAATDQPPKASGAMNHVSLKPRTLVTRSAASIIELRAGVRAPESTSDEDLIDMVAFLLGARHTGMLSVAKIRHHVLQRASRVEIDTIDRILTTGPFMTTRNGPYLCRNDLVIYRDDEAERREHALRAEYYDGMREEAQRISSRYQKSVLPAISQTPA